VTDGADNPWIVLAGENGLVLVAFEDDRNAVTRFFCRLEDAVLVRVSPVDEFQTEDRVTRQRLNTRSCRVGNFGTQQAALSL
jgi:hypothetical protein